MANLSATQRVLCIPPLLQNIFEFSTNNVSNACVCRAWLDEALNVIWDDLRDLEVLLSLLAPLTGSPLEFSRHIELEDWERFNRYSWRVHKAVLFNYYDWSVFSAIDSTRSRPHILPNLQTFSCEVGFAAIHLFVHPGLRDLSFKLWRDDTLEEIDTAFSCITTRAPLLKSLTIYPDGILPNLDHGVESLVVRMLRGLGSLISLSLPPHWLTPTIIRIIASLDVLETLKCTSYCTNPGAVFSSTLPAGSFPALRCLDIQMSLERAQKCFTGAYLPHTLVSLTLKSPCPKAESVSQFGSFIDTITSICKRLECLRLDHFPDDFYNSHNSPRNFITLATLRPLLSCQNLKILYLAHPIPFALGIEDLVSIVKALPLLTVLSLNPYPNTSCKGKLDLAGLLEIIPFCDNLQRLELRITTRPSLPYKDEYMHMAFPKLKYLFIGSSHIPEPIPVSAFLSRILPAGCKVGFPAIGDNRCTLVQDLVPVLQEVRNEGRQMAYLERELIY